MKIAIKRISMVSHSPLLSHEQILPMTWPEPSSQVRESVLFSPQATQTNTHNNNNLAVTMDTAVPANNMPSSPEPKERPLQRPTTRETRLAAMLFSSASITSLPKQPEGEWPTPLQLCQFSASCGI